LLLGVRLLPDRKGETVAWQNLTSEVGPLTIVRSDRRVFRERAKLVEYLTEAEASQPAPWLGR
jgi:hypothetical protein